LTSVIVQQQWRANILLSGVVGDVVRSPTQAPATNCHRHRGCCCWWWSLLRQLASTSELAADRNVVHLIAFVVDAHQIALATAQKTARM